MTAEGGKTAERKRKGMKGCGKEKKRKVYHKDD